MKAFKYGLLIVYIVFVVVVTLLLFTFNKFSNSVIGYTTIIGNTTEIENYKKGDLFIVTKSDDIQKGDTILFYDTKKGHNFLNSSKVKNIIHTNENETTYVIRDNIYLSSEYVIGKTTDIKCISFLGYLYLLFTNKIGYLLFVIVPITTYLIILLRKYRKS